MSLRHYIFDTYNFCISTHGFGQSVAPYVAFDYNTCDVNADCIDNACVCKSPYIGTGTTCSST